MGWVSMSSDSTVGPSKAPQPCATSATGAHGCFPRRDVKCGTLLCLSDNTSPVLGSGSYSLFFGRFKCKAVIAGSDANEVMAKLRLVPTGAKCGEEMVSGPAAVPGWQGGDDCQPQQNGAASEPPCLPPGLLRWSLPEPPRLRRQELLSQVQQPRGMLRDHPLLEQLWGPGQQSQPLLCVCATLTLSSLIPGVQSQAGVSL